MTAREVAKALGRTVTAPTESSAAATDQLAGRSGCAWSSRDESAAVLVELVRTKDVARSVRRTGFSAAARFQAAVTDNPTAESIDSLGDRALFAVGASQLWLLVDDDLVIFEVAVTPTSGARDVALHLAATAESRLQRAD
ncbi:MAG TPA: hypothetical protein VM143_01215 [Acidimicrobiales bacterium]|nr:hypothetical protein [Acidimicrobiales bacterium]